MMTEPILAVVARNLSGWLQKSLANYSFEEHGYAIWKAIDPYELSELFATAFRMGMWYLGIWMALQGLNVDFAPTIAAGSALIIDLLPQLMAKIKKKSSGK